MYSAGTCRRPRFCSLPVLLHAVGALRATARPALVPTVSEHGQLNRECESRFGLLTCLDTLCVADTAPVSRQPKVAAVPGQNEDYEDAAPIPKDIDACEVPRRAMTGYAFPEIRDALKHSLGLAG